MAWKDINENGGTGGILSLQAGESALVHIIGEPKSFWEHFFQAMQRSLICPHRGCPACNNDKTKARLRHAFIVYDLNEKQVKTWAVSNTVALAVKNVWESYGGDLSEVDLKIKRTGTGLSTKYSVVPVKTSYDEAMVAGVDLPDLDSIFAPATEEEIKAMLEDELAERGEEPEEESPKSKPAAKKGTAKKAVKAEAVEEDAESEEEPAAKPEAKPETKAAPAPASGADRMTVLRRCLPKFGKLDAETKQSILGAFSKKNLAALSLEELLQAEQMM